MKKQTNKSAENELLISTVKEWIEGCPSLPLSPVVNDLDIRFHLTPKEYLKFNKSEYDLSIDIYKSLKNKKNHRLLTNFEIKRLKDYNIGGVFGYSKEVERISNKFNIKPQDVVNILYKYNNLGNFYNSYIKNELLTGHDIDIAESIFTNLYDIDDNPDKKNYDMFIKNFLKLRKKVLPNEDGLIFYSSKGLEEAFKHLTDKEVRIIKSYYGFDSGKKSTYEEVGKDFQISGERVRQIIFWATHAKLAKAEIKQTYIGDLSKIIEKSDLEQREISTLYVIDGLLRLSTDFNNKSKYLDKIRNLFLSSIKNNDDTNSIKFEHNNSDLTNEEKFNKELVDQNDKINIKETDIDRIRKETEKIEQRIEEKKQKAKLLEEYIRLINEQDKLTKIESDLDEEIKQKKEILKSYKLKNVNKPNE